MSDSGRIDSDELDPDIRRFVTAVQQSYARHPGFGALPLQERRSVAETVRVPWLDSRPDGRSRTPLIPRKPLFAAGLEGAGRRPESNYCLRRWRLRFSIIEPR